MLRKTLFGVLALAALATGASVAVIALAFALYTALLPALGAAGSAAIVGVVFIVVILLVALVATGKGHHQPEPEEDTGLLEHIFNIARAKPLLAAGAAVAAGLIAIRNPALVATIAAAFINRPKSRD